jgi:hypothetical protein
MFSNRGGANSLFTISKEESKTAPYFSNEGPGSQK